MSLALGPLGPTWHMGSFPPFPEAVAKSIFLMSRKEALDAGIDRIKGYIKKGLSRGKINPKAAKAMEAGVIPTMEIKDLAECDYVIEAASENLSIKQAILKSLEEVVSADCLIGFATSGIPRSQIAANAKHPERCFVNHPFFPAWRALPMEVVLSGDQSFSDRMLGTLKQLGKVPIVTKDVACFAADDIFCTYCAEAARIVAEGTATPAQVDRIVNDAIGGGGPFNVMDLTKGNLLNIHCLELMRDAPTGSPWFEPPPILRERKRTHLGSTPRIREIPATTRLWENRCWIEFLPCSSAGLTSLSTTMFAIRPI